MEAFKRRLSKLAGQISSTYQTRRCLSKAQLGATQVFSILEICSALTLVILSNISDFTGRLGLQIASGIILVLSVLINVIPRLQERAFINKNDTVALQRLNRRLDQLVEVAISDTPVTENMERQFETLCNEYDYIKAPGNTQGMIATVQSPHNNPLINVPYRYPLPLMPPPPPYVMETGPGDAPTSS